MVDDQEIRTVRQTPQTQVAAIGPAERERLRSGRVLIVGVGGLGTPAALCLASAGVGTLGLLDDDSVEPSNLPRQILYGAADVGRPKVEVAAEHLTALWPKLSVECVYRRLNADNLVEMFQGFDFVIDGTDGIATKYLVNDGAVLRGMPFSHAGVLGFCGQALTILPRRSACLRCVFPIPPSDGDVPTCQEAGVIGAVAGTMGALQAAEALKYLLGVGSLLTDRLLTYDGARRQWRLVNISPVRGCPLCGEAPTIHRLEPIYVPAGGCQFE